jgi:replicative DNA helicase
MAQVRAFNPPQPVDSQVAALKLPPHSIEAEQSLIGGLLIDNAAWDRIGDVVRETDFYRDDHRRIFRHIGKLIQMARPADVVTVYESIEASNEVDQTGGLAYLGEIANATPSAANIRRYAEIVRERAILRQLVTVGDEIAGNALNPAGRDVKALLDDAEQRIFQIAEAGNRANNGFVPIQPLLGEVVERMEGLLARDSQSDITGVATGFVDLDRLTAACNRATCWWLPGGRRWARPRSRSTSPSTSVSSCGCRWRSSAWKCPVRNWPRASSPPSAASTRPSCATAASPMTNGTA